MQENVIAKKYAMALAKACKNNTKELESAFHYFSEISKAFGLAKFSAIVYSHIITRDKKLELIKSFSAVSVDKNTQKLLELIVHNDRISLLPFVAREIKKILDSKANAYEAILYFKENVNESSLQNIKTRLGKKLGVALDITQKIDTSVDGIRLEVADLGIEVVFLRDRFMQDLQQSILKAI